jgi:hypothetical protein
LLDRPGTAVVSCPAAAMDTPQATGASLTCAETPHGTVVQRPRLAVELPTARLSHDSHIFRKNVTDSEGTRVLEFS